MIYEFPDAADEDTVYLENQQGEFINRDNPEEILAYRVRFEQLRELSLGPKGSESYLEQASGGDDLIAGPRHGPSPAADSQ